MILSASRRTDIPNYYSEWFFNRIKDGFVCVRNPMNPHQVSRISLSPAVVDCIVFWTKNPANMMDKLELLKDYRYYFQFTITPYGKETERNIPDKIETIIPTFKRLSDMIGPKRVIWRYDPIFFNDYYTPDCHIEMFDRFASELKGYTEKCVISFVDVYRKNKKNLEKSDVYMPDDNYLLGFCKELKSIADKKGLDIATCAEKIDLSSVGISHNSCIDKGLIEDLIGCRIETKKDKNQREECGCVESIDIGAYNTCMNLCNYCYANFSTDTVMNNRHLHDVDSPLICGGIKDDDIINNKKVSSIKAGYEQLDLWNLN